MCKKEEGAVNSTEEGWEGGTEGLLKPDLEGRVADTGHNVSGGHSLRV